MSGGTEGAPREKALQEALQEALKLAQEAERIDEVPVGALVLDASLQKVLGRGFNRRECDHDPVGHAEIAALREAAQALGSWRLIDCVLVVTLEPCPMCLAAAQQARVARVVYAAEDPKGGALSLGYRLNEDLRLNHRFEVQRVDQPECSQILREFFRKKRQKPL